jgi:hypothetical protein
LGAQLSDGSLSLVLPVKASPRPNLSHAAEEVHASARRENVNDCYIIEATSSFPKSLAMQAQQLVMESTAPGGCEESYETHKNIYRPDGDVASRSGRPDVQKRMYLLTRQGTYLTVAFDIVAST